MARDKFYTSHKIFFYRLNIGYNAIGEPIQYDIKSVLEAINNLGFQNKARYLKDEDDFETCCWIDEMNPPQKVRFGKIKRDDLPQMEHGGDLVDLSIPDECGLAECVHIMFFPENIVGLEYNYDGPRPARISAYLHEKAKNVYPQEPVFEQLLQHDVMKQLEHMRGVRQFKLKVRNSLFNSIEQADESLAKTFQAARELGQAQEIELVLSVGRGKGTLGAGLLGRVKRLIERRDTNYDIISGEIRGYNETGKMEVIDLLNTKITKEKRIPRNQTRTSVPQRELVYAAIDEAYHELKDQIISAVGATLCPV